MSSENLEMLMSSIDEVTSRISYLDSLLKGNRPNLSKVVSPDYGIDIAIDDLSQASLVLINVIYQIENLEPTDESAFVESIANEKDYRWSDARDLLIDIKKSRKIFKDTILYLDTLNVSLSEVLNNLKSLINILDRLKTSIHLFRTAEGIALAYDPNGDIFTVDKMVSILTHRNFENIDLSNLPLLSSDELKVGRGEYLSTLCNFNKLSSMLYSIYCKTRLVYDGIFGQSIYYTGCGFSSDVIKNLVKPDLEYKKNLIPLYQKLVRSIIRHIKENCKGRMVKEIIPTKYSFSADRNLYSEVARSVNKIPFHAMMPKSKDKYRNISRDNIEFVILPLIMYNYKPNQSKMVKVAKGLIRLY